MRKQLRQPAAFSPAEKSTLAALPGWPTVWEMNTGETYALHRKIDGALIERRIRLIQVREYWEPDCWTGKSGGQTLRMAAVTVDVSGETATLLCRPYQLPATVNGLRLYVEATRRGAGGSYNQLAAMQSDVRLSAVGEKEEWGPDGFLFPIRDYRWRSSSYNNTWLSLVPYNELYYHRGEDFGAIPDRLPVIAGINGVIVGTPLPNGDGQSNGVILETEAGVRLRYAHMNIETIDPSLTLGRRVPAGFAIAKTGMTWSGRKSQTHDPHLHFDIQAAGTYLSAYPLVLEAYFRSYPDAVAAVAGGYYFATPGLEVELDGRRSVARPGQRIKEYTWRLHTGESVNTARLKKVYPTPGLFSEELIVRTEDGHEDRDFAQVRVYDPARGRNMARGWMYATPVRGLLPGAEVLFWNRLREITSDAHLDFGDGSPSAIVNDSISHAYRQPGIYTAALRAQGPDREPVTIKIRVVVEDI